MSFLKKESDYMYSDNLIETAIKISDESYQSITESFKCFHLNRLFNADQMLNSFNKGLEKSMISNIESCINELSRTLETFPVIVYRKLDDLPSNCTIENEPGFKVFKMDLVMIPNVSVIDKIIKDSHKFEVEYKLDDLRAELINNTKKIKRAVFLEEVYKQFPIKNTYPGNFNEEFIIDYKKSVKKNVDALKKHINYLILKLRQLKKANIPYYTSAPLYDKRDNARIVTELCTSTLFCISSIISIIIKQVDQLEYLTKGR